MIKHTPGPWQVVFWLVDPDDDESKMRYVFAPRIKPLGSKSYFEIAACYTGDVSDEQGEANAQLIAAAPDMLAALKTINKFYVFIDSNLRPNEGEGCREAFSQLRAAIAKAEGVI